MTEKTKEEAAQDYADEMVRRSEWASLTMSSDPESAMRRTVAWHCVRQAYLELAP